MADPCSRPQLTTLLQVPRMYHVTAFYVIDEPVYAFFSVQYWAINEIALELMMITTTIVVGLLLLH